MIRVSSNFDNRTNRPTGGFVAATRRPWYLRVLHPLTVPEANPPSQFVSSHSRLRAASRLVQISSPNRIMARSQEHAPLLREKLTTESCFHLHMSAREPENGKSGTEPR